MLLRVSSPRAVRNARTAFAGEVPAACVLAAVLAACAALAVPGTVRAGPVAEPDSVAVELNKIEPQGKNCRAYMVVSNTTATAYTVFKLDLVMFSPDGIIGQRFAIDLAPIRPNKRTVKLFDLGETGCDSVGSFLVNDVLECKAEAGPLKDCLSRLKTSSLAKVQLSK